MMFAITFGIISCSNNNNQENWGVYITTPSRDAERLSNELDKKLKKADGNLQDLLEVNNELEEVLEEMTNLYFTERDYQQTQEFVRLLKDNVVEVLE